MYKDKNEDFQNLLKNVTHGKALVTIGKNGITKTVREELKLQLDKKGIVKVKILRSCLIQDYDAALKKLAEETSSLLYKQLGRTGIFINKIQSITSRKSDKTPSKYSWQRKRSI
ncbi:MAG: YhbY family RNA-binding protein [Candidatus Hermodarchaeota archaeon]